MIRQTAEKEDVVFDVGRIQRKASDPSGSFWVRASAGSGKTKVLADRITRLLLAGVPPHKILCLTFTRAAAAEMAVRLMNRLSRWATCEDSVLEEDLLDLQGHALASEQRVAARRLFAHVLAAPGGMRIQTIHAFAQEVLGRFPLEAGVAPHFRVLEEKESQALRHEALMGVVQGITEDFDDKRARAALSLWALRGDEKALAELMGDIEAQGEKWLETLAQAGGIDALLAQIARHLGFEDGENEEKIIEKACRKGVFDEAGLVQAAQLMAEEGAATTQEAGRALLVWLKGNEETRCAGFEVYAHVFLTKENEERKILVNKKLAEQYPDIVQILDAEKRRIFDVYARLESRRIFDEGAAVMLLAVRVQDAYARRKAALAALDYDDLIVRAGALLAQDGAARWVLFKLDGGVDHILLDEAQDTSPAQWAIVKALTDEFFAGHGASREEKRTLFVVGDEKQSIYSFLKADPATFDRQRATFAQQGVVEVPLDVSFRSAPVILRAVDAVFAAEDVRKGVSSVPVAHRAFRAGAPGRVELLELVTREEEEGRLKEAQPWVLPEGYESAHDPAFELARALAARIKAWSGGAKTVYDREDKVFRPSRAGDILVLVQKRGPLIDHLVRALKKSGVPTAGTDRMVLTEQLAVLDLVALLNFTLLPQDDLTLACILRGPLIGAREDDMMALLLRRPRGVSVWQRLQEMPRFAAWHDYLVRVAGRADHCTPFALLQEILNLPCPADPEGCGRRALMARLGPEAEDPIDELLTLAENYGAQEGPSLQAFLHWLFSSQTQIKREMEQAKTSVRIATVHGAKGLESPIVVLPDAARVPEATRLPKILWDKDTGLPFYVPRKTTSAFLTDLRELARRKQLEEYRRLLYVGLTRAADHLVVCGFEPGKNKAFDKSWFEIVRKAWAPLSAPLPAEEKAPKCLAVLEDIGSVSLGGRRTPEELRSAVSAPAWLFAPPPPEAIGLKPLVPSRQDEESAPSLPSPRDPRFARGRMMHKLLEALPDLPPEKREGVARRFLAASGLYAQEQDEIVREVSGLLQGETFAPLFGSASKAEVPLIGDVGERRVSGQVDRLAFVGDEVWIVDYKTNRPPPGDIPPVYRAQMEAYRAVLQQVYPGKTVRCFLLWTHTARMAEIKS